MIDGILNMPVVEKPVLKNLEHSFRGVLRERFSANMQQIYRRMLIPMPKCGFKKVAKQLY